MTLDVLSLIFPGFDLVLSTIVIESNRTVFIFRSWFDLLDVVLGFLIFILKSSSHFKTIDTRLQI